MLPIYELAKLALKIIENWLDVAELEQLFFRSHAAWPNFHLKLNKKIKCYEMINYIYGTVLRQNCEFQTRECQDTTASPMNSKNLYW